MPGLGDTRDMKQTQITRRDLPPRPAPLPTDTRTPSGKKALPW